MADSRSPSETERREYENWARENIGGTREQIQAAVQALVLAKANGANAQAAVAAAREAARGASAAPRSHGGPPPVGSIVGIARRVQQSTQFSGQGANLQVLNFELEQPGEAAIRVQLRGPLLYGTVNDGDEIAVKRPSGDARFIQADRVFNRTANSYVHAQKGLFASTEAQLGRTGARLTVILTVIICALVVAVLIFIGVMMLKTKPRDANPDLGKATSWCCDINWTSEKLTSVSTIRLPASS
ncbi:hypothetical protein [Nocardia abscessus]|uniref:hypothetical protein n=1 Tax=Nocardia abscessus TaxID=120957 RepID=UPI0024572265|nr:hypothetical protein [Nocardia abscessus]